MARTATPRRPRPARGPPHLARRPAPRHERAVRRRAGRDPRRGRASRLRPDRHHQRHRALPPPHPLHPHPGLPARPTSGTRRRSRSRVFEYWTHALSYIPTRDFRFYVAAMRRHRTRGPRLVRQCLRRRHAQGHAPPPRRRPALDPRHRRRRAGRQASSLGQPQAVEGARSSSPSSWAGSPSASGSACSRPTT